MLISVQEASFDVGALYQTLSQNPQHGAVVTFTGLVRDYSSQTEQAAHQLESMTLEHYPGMTEKALMQIAQEAKQRWSIGQVIMIHRVGTLKINEPIVFVGVSSGHRKEAFEAAEFLMDYLKTRAPFWKKEQSAQGAHWVEAKASDQQAAKRWQTSSPLAKKS